MNEYTSLAGVARSHDAAGAMGERRFCDDLGNAFDGNKPPVLVSAAGNLYGFQDLGLDPRNTPNQRGNVGTA
jgi:hypothetical protein